MEEEKIIRGATEDEIWQQIKTDLTGNPDLLDYSVVIKHSNRIIYFDIFIDLGGGFEGGFKSTILRTALRTTDDFKFAVHPQGFIDEIGKFFGMQDVVTGHSEFDKNLIIKSNNESKVKAIFSDALTREVFQSLHDFTFGIIMHHINHDQKGRFLEFYSDTAITDTTELKKIYSAFCKVLTVVDSV